MNNNRVELKNYQKLNTLPLHIELWHPESSCPLHHHDCVELLLATKGSILCQVNNSSLKFTKGDLFVISGDLVHAIYDVKNFSAYRILFDFSLLDNLCEDIKNSPGYTALFLMSSLGYTKYGYPSCLYVKDFYFDRISAILNDMILEYQSETYLQANYLQQCFYMALTLILKAFDDRVRHKAHTPAVPAVSIMQQHLHEKISVAEIAKHFGISENYFRIVFEEHWGTSPLQFITDLRIRRAKTLLSLSDKPIIEIAMACGFYDSSHFSNVFLKKVGYTPSEYRKKHSSF